tara:strand:+ start:172 stop:603 length:432 start_codon:yes stop_codon:yes gene_type:complete
VINKIAIASDHAGFLLKKSLIEQLQSDVSIEDLGTNSEESCDFPDFADKVGEFVLDNNDTRGVLICSTGVGMAIAANKNEGIRASNVMDAKTAIQSVEHNNVNVLCLGSENLSIEDSKEIVLSFLAASFIDEERFIRRVNKFE